MPELPPPGTSFRQRPIGGWLQLLRPANIATAPADVLAGAAVAGALIPPSPALPWLIVATMALYGGGIVLNDVFDRHLDAVERPERPIPSGRVPAGAARFIGFLLLLVGVGAASFAGPSAAMVAVGVAVAVLAYDIRSKHHAIAGPFTMGLCRALNLLLGVAAVPGALASHWPIALLPLVYIAGVTVVSRGEVHGSRRPAAAAGLVMVGGVVGGLLVMAVAAGRAAPWPSLDRLVVTAVAIWLGARVIPRFAAVLGEPVPPLIGRAVRTGVLSLVLVDTVIAGAYAGIMAIPAVLAAGAIAWLLARLFAVT